MGKFKIALIQLNTGENKESNRLDISQRVADAADKGAELVILPEHSDAIGKHERRFAEPVPGEMSLFYSALAKKHHIYLHCGSMTEENAGNSPYNTSLVFNKGGEQIALYRKLHMFDVDIPNGPSVFESRGVSKGDRISIVNTELCTIGLSICYDVRFAELYRLMAKNGAQLLVVSANFTENTGRLHWETLVRARAIENGCYVAAVDQCGQKYNFTAWGHTMLVDPMGKIIAELEQESGTIIADIDTSLVEKAQSQIPVLKNTRDDIYTLSSEYIHKY